MRRITVVGMIILSLVAMPLVVAAAPALKGKTEICHIAGNGDAQMIEISLNAVAAHEAHGDTETCSIDETTVPLEAAFTFTILVETCSFFGCEVELDASSSEGNIDSYFWVASNGENAVGANAKIMLPNFATSTVTLAVDGPDGTATATQEIAIAFLP